MRSHVRVHQQRMNITVGPWGGGIQESFRHHAKKPEPGPGTHPPPLPVSKMVSYAHKLYLYVVLITSGPSAVKVWPDLAQL
jgi:hypothetical protein